MCEIRTALNDLGKADDPFERSGALEALAATLRREAPASVVMGAGTAELVATGGARKIAKEIADAPRDEADARLERLQSIARPHRIKEPLSPRRRHLLERNDLPVRGTLLEPPPVATGSVGGPRSEERRHPHGARFGGAVAAAEQNAAAAAGGLGTEGVDALGRRLRGHAGRGAGQRGGRSRPPGRVILS